MNSAALREAQASKNLRLKQDKPDLEILDGCRSHRRNHCRLENMPWYNLCRARTLWGDGCSTSVWTDERAEPAQGLKPIGFIGTTEVVPCYKVWYEAKCMNPYEKWP